MSNSKQHPPSTVIEKLGQISIMISDADSSLSDGWAYSGINSLFVGYELLLTLVADGIGWPHPNNPRGSRGIADLLDEEYYPNGFGQTHEHSRAFHRMMYQDSFRIDEALACCKTLYATTSLLFELLGCPTGYSRWLGTRFPAFTGETLGVMVGMEEPVYDEFATFLEPGVFTIIPRKESPLPIYELSEWRPPARSLRTKTVGCFDRIQLSPKPVFTRNKFGIFTKSMNIVPGNLILNLDATDTERGNLSWREVDLKVQENSLYVVELGDWQLVESSN